MIKVRFPFPDHYLNMIEYSRNNRHKGGQDIWQLKYLELIIQKTLKSKMGILGIMEWKGGSDYVQEQE